MSDLFPLTRPIVPDTSGWLPDSVCCFLSGIAKEKASFLWGLSEPEKEDLVFDRLLAILRLFEKGCGKVIPEDDEKKRKI